MRQLFAILIICLTPCTAVFPQSNGIIQCDPASMTTVPAWSSPGKPHVAEQLPCGQAVTVLGMENTRTLLEYSSRPSEYAKIQRGEKVIYVDAKYVRLLGPQDAVQTSKAESEVAGGPSVERDAEQKKLGLIAKEDLKIRDEYLLRPVVINGPRTFSSTVSNNSKFALSQIQLLVRIYDCSGPHKSDYSNCEIIGEARPTASAPIPPGQTRRVTAEALFQGTPRVKGTFAWNYWITGILAE
jgi:hypothetical protein